MRFRVFVVYYETSARTYLPLPERDPGFFLYERSGGWADEDVLVRADDIVRVTDPAWIGHLAPGDAWGTTMYPLDADSPSSEDLPHVPDVHAPTVLRPFGTGGTQRLAFSADARFLAVEGEEDEVEVYDCADWSEYARLPCRAPTSPGT
ncbi:hypothetical protein [Marinitenerispora sediminis]|uniref:Uncharacterized protein n=1 Tax=Marinitenerispora sediminis TaxID=1931232 RepID=A0A368T8T7_9ACTN|nr:hypothetical protein [Marinitenerispora sediminis]RCV47887.1 hypothetical protein DEF28_25050 [Marinitenerispora sediminis]RCV48671.1 hypothetical protein DEF23_24730 [Marinitenerispora sediminis]RCV60437.1 hypothetical protein DEF24_07080 [Marinitenerispora sediminis]